MPKTPPLAWLVLAVLLFGLPAQAAPPRLVERPDWKARFEAAGVTGTMVLHKDGSDEILVFDAARAATPFLPASTFKILNALIALETRAVSGPEEIFPYDGTPRAMPAWNADLTLKQAFAVSCVPVFQEIARRIGPERMAWYVAASGYGNADIGGGLDRFWLDGSLRLSALDQIAFLSRLHHRQLPFSAATVEKVLDIMVVESTPEATLRAKTGWTARVSPGIGWYVGLLTRGADTWYFALDIDIDRPSQAGARQDVARAILHAQGLL